ncbi:MAG: replicative DNA helicase [Bryobacteraceae bacterium]|nr:replicative DNA helicase [Bryobacteraceae bacterium]
MATQQSTRNPEFERGLPSNVYAERMVLGAILLNDSTFVAVASALLADDFSVEKHRKIFRRMVELNEREERIDRVTLANELMKYGELEAVDGLSYLISLDEGLPELHNLESYVQIVKEKAVLRELIYSSQEIMQRCYMGEEAPSGIISAAQTSLLKLSESQTKADLVSARQVFENYEGGVGAFLDPSHRESGLHTGFIKFDDMTGGLHGGELFILAARPAMGKTALALNIALHMATHPRTPKGVAVFSLEMSKESLMTRLICSRARVNQQKFRIGALDRDERGRLSLAATDLFDAPIYIDDTSSTTMMDINAKLRKLRTQTELGLVVVDYLQLMPTTSLGKNSNRTQEVGALSRGMKLLAKDLNVPFLVLSQLSRAPEQRIGDHRPQLSDLRESGSIEQDADLVAFIFRPEVYQKDREDLRGVAELILSKQRNGPTGKVPLVFLHEYTKFENPADDFVDEEG